MNNRYCNSFPGDSLYWYNERATLSSLAAAVWKGNGYALEEYRTDKRYGKDKWAGRADLWFTDGKKEYLVEAKQILISLSPRSYRSFENISEALKDAKADVVCNREYAQTRLGVVFVVPYISPSEKMDSKTLIKTFIERLYNEVEYDFMAYFFPQKSSINHKGYSYPGVAMFARVTKRQ